MKKIQDELLFRLILAVMAGLFLGSFIPESWIQGIIVIKNLLSQLIFFTIPLVILGFITPAIAHLKNNASQLLRFALILAYSSTIGAALLGMSAGYLLVPQLDISSQNLASKQLPQGIFSLDISPIMPVMSALVLALLLGLGISSTKSTLWETLLDDFQKITLYFLSHLVIPLLPYFIACTFTLLAYQGSLQEQLPIFFTVILLAILGQWIWLGILYGIASLYSKERGKEVFRHYAPAYWTAIGSMSSAATLPVSLTCCEKSTVLSKETIHFSVPLFSNIHLCGSVLTEVFFVMVVSQVLYGNLPSIIEMLWFIPLLALFGIGAPGVPGGTVMASLGLITGILGFDQEGTALMMTIFALQDSFGTACNVAGDGALTLMVEAYRKKTSSSH